MPGLLSELLRPDTQARFAQDWTRQRRTAEDILQRLRSQEGVILADQVGMGKTYVALAVAVSQILHAGGHRQVVVFVPAAVADKWVREWSKFAESLLVPGHGVRCVPHALRSGEEFLKALDAPPNRRSHLLVVTHTALTATLKDTFIQLALLHFAMRDLDDDAGTRLRGRIAKWSTGRHGLFLDTRLTTRRVAALLDAAPAMWRSIWREQASEELPDDPVPSTLEAAARILDLSDLRSTIEGLPVNASADMDRRLRRAREALARITQLTWKWMLSSIEQDLPLLIVDEAHRLKNDATQISRLFASRQSPDSRADGSEGVFDGIFRRMLFLTATPFELGHRELLGVLGRMNAVRPMVPAPRLPLDARLKALGKVLTAAQHSALAFDAAWGRLSSTDAPAFDGWAPDALPPLGLSTPAREAWEHARLTAKARQEMHAALQPWVIRHTRPHRRSYHPGQAILLGDRLGGGLEVPRDAALPFLLAARAQSVGQDAKGPARPLFAYGIASSYEAYLRLGSAHRDDGRDADEEPEAAAGRPPGDAASTGDPGPVHWYRSEIERALSDPAIREAHPKVRATVDRAAQLWLQGDKCLVFSWYIRTGEALDRILAKRIDQMILEQASSRLGIAGLEDTRVVLGHLSERLFRSDGASHERFKRRLAQALLEDAGGHQDVVDLVVDTAIRHLRTPSYLVRYTRLHEGLDEAQVWSGINGDNDRGIAVLERWRQFARRLAEARGQAGNLKVDDGPNIEFARLRTALLGAEDVDGTQRRGASLHPVRRASGQTERHVRERLIALFNTPFAPDALVASSVMGEGIDLHQECRHVIHHDLDWNPSILEQRTGRLDRIGALAEREGLDIQVFEPYLAGTHDEKMFRVVKDRAAWFDVVMGRPSGSDEAGTDQEEGRLALHEKIRAALVMDLSSGGRSSSGS